MDKFREYWNKPAHIAYLFIAPAMILLLLFNIIPLIASLVISTFDVSMTLNDARFVGWEILWKPSMTAAFGTVCG